MTILVGSSVASADRFRQQCGSDALVCGDVGQAAELAARECDVVYVASPNSLHAEHATAFLDAGVSVIVEKPAFAHPAELARAQRLADARGVLLLEAARHRYEPNYGRLADRIRQLGPLSGAQLIFRQYSSKLAAYQHGDRPRVFDAQWAGGALADLGVYLLYAAIDWFGMPEAAHYGAQVLPDTGADACGWGVLHYPAFRVDLAISKMHQSYAPSEVYTADGRTLVVNHVTEIARAELSGRDVTGQELVLDRPADNPMRPEVDFAAALLSDVDAALTDPRYRQACERAAQVARVTLWMRQDAGIVFPGDAAFEQGSDR